MTQRQMDFLYTWAIVMLILIIWTFAYWMRKRYGA
jgi:hypothetical protein